MKALLVMEYDEKTNKFGVNFNFDPEGSNSGYGTSTLQYISNAARQAAVAAIDYLGKSKIVFCPPADIQNEIIAKQKARQAELKQ